MHLRCDLPVLGGGLRLRGGVGGGGGGGVRLCDRLVEVGVEMGWLAGGSGCGVKGGRF